MIGVVGNVQNFVVTGGTERFANASGPFLGTGTINFSAGPPVARLTIGEGVIAIPQPATWGLMLAGFMIVGVAVRSKRDFIPVRRAI